MFAALMISVEGGEKDKTRNVCTEFEILDQMVWKGFTEVTSE